MLKKQISILISCTNQIGIISKMEDERTKFNAFADQFLEKHDNQLFTEKQAQQNLEAATANSTRLNKLCEQAASELPAFELTEQQHEQLVALLNAFYHAGFGDGIDFTVNHSESSLHLGATLLTERYHATQDGGKKANPYKQAALEIAEAVTRERPELKTSAIVRITYQRMRSFGADELPAKRTVEGWIYKARKKTS